MVWSSLPVFFSWKTASEALWLASSISFPSCLPLSESCFASAFLPPLKASCKAVFLFTRLGLAQISWLTMLMAQSSPTYWCKSTVATAKLYLRLLEVLTPLFSVLVGFCSPVVMGLISSCWGGLLLAHGTSKFGLVFQKVLFRS